MLYLAAVPGRTPRMLLQLLWDLGVLTTQDYQEATGVVSYGRLVHRGKDALPTLNARAGTRNKFQELQALQAADVSVPVHGQNFQAVPMNNGVLSRAFHHTKGRDIRYDNFIAEFWPAPRANYYVEFIPKVREYRVWAYRRRPLAVYEKRLTFPRRNRWARRHGRLVDIVWNWGTGYAFEFYHEAPQALKDLGARAIDALGLDFGAADIIEDRDGRLYVLEVNTAPGVREPRQGLVFLAKKIANWERLGYPRRNGERDVE